MNDSPLLEAIKHAEDEWRRNHRRFEEKMQRIERMTRWIWFSMGFSVGAFFNYCATTWRTVNAPAAECSHER